MDDTVLIVFLRVPEKGRVKTRLASEFNEEFVLQLYKGFIKDLLETVEPVRRKILYFWPEEMAWELESFVGDRYKCHPQQGKNLGEKMATAFENVFDAGAQRAVLIGTDIPEINRDILFQAAKVLNGKEAVIGPAGDGGYYLIGFRRSGYCQGVFENIEWSGPKVFEQTIGYLEKKGVRYGMVARLEDIDTPQDLKKLAFRASRFKSAGPRTCALLESI